MTLGNVQSSENVDSDHLVNVPTASLEERIFRSLYSATVDTGALGYLRKEANDSCLACRHQNLSLSS